MSIYREFRRLEHDPFGLSTKKIKDTKNGYRFRVGRYRIFYALFSKDNSIEVVDIFLKKGEKDYRKRRRLF